SNATYDLPFGPNGLLFKSAPGFVQRIVEGWQLSSITSWQSGAPLAFSANGLGVTPAGPLTLYNNATNTFDQVGPLPKGSLGKGSGFVTYFPTLTTVAPKNVAPTFNADNALLQNAFTNQIVVDPSGNTIFKNADPGRIGNMSLNSVGIRGPGILSFNAAI